MTTRYVGIGGSDSNDGLSWANRKLTLNGVEDTPVVAGDIIYVGPGVYRESLTVDVAGSNGSPITYIGDVTGEHTDGVGGVVRITGSNDDQSTTRSNCINLPNARSYRTLRGFSLDTSTGDFIIINPSSSNVIIEDCSFLGGTAVGANCVTVNGTGTNNTIRRCLFQGNMVGVIFSHTVTVDNVGGLVENCLFRTSGMNVRIDRVGGVTVKNCTSLSGSEGVRVVTALAGGQTTTVNNCIFTGVGTALRATVTSEMTEDYNLFYNNTTNYSTVTPGSNSLTYPPVINPPILLDGFRFPWMMGELSKWSKVARQAGSSEATDDLFGIARPATSSKKSWGAIQSPYNEDGNGLRETTTTDGSSPASIKLPDAVEHFLMRIPVTNVSTVVSIKCYREADYAGTLPQLIIRQPGQSDRTTTDTGSASAWNTLTDTFTPASLPPYIDMFIKSNNTATTGNYDVFFDTLSIS